MLSTINKYLLNAKAHYNIKNRIEYLMLCLNPFKPKHIQIECKAKFHIDNTYIVTLTQSLDRRENILRHLLKQKHCFRFIIGINGKPGYYKGIPISTRSFRYLKAGSIGCWLSHYKAWSIAVGSNSNYTLILEDDVVLDKDFYSKLENHLAHIPDNFDVLYVDSGNRTKRNMRAIINNTVFCPYQIRNGAYAYIISLPGAKKLLELIPNIEVTRGGVDSAMGSLIRNNKIIAYHLLDKICQVNFSFQSSTK